MIEKILVLDVETFYSQEFSLRRMSVPEYVMDPRFAVHILAAYDIEWPAPRIIEAPDIPAFFEQYPAATTMTISHNALFDNAVFAWKYGWVPVRMVDTLGMCRSLRTYKKYSLNNVLTELFGYSDKGDVLYKVKGLNIQGIKNAGLWSDYKSYALRDAKNCANIYFKLLPEFPEEEQKIMDLVLRCAVVPRLHADIPLLQDHLNILRKHKAKLLVDCGYDKAALMSTKQFQEALEGLGVEVDMKLSPTNRLVPAFAKTDPFMQNLLEYAGAETEEANHQVQCLAAARLSHKSTIEETRCQRFLNIARLPWGNGAGCKYPNCDGGPATGYCHKNCRNPLLPVALRYGGAHTHRLSGEWSMNMQNLPRDRAKSRLRQALKAPPGYKLVAADLSQIEARIVAVLAQEDGLVAAFRKGEDIYANFASIVFGKKVDKVNQPLERFLGKTAILGLGYGCGAPRFRQMVITGAKQSGIPFNADDFDEIAASKVVYAYRNLFQRIPQMWSFLDNKLAMVINDANETQAVPWGPVEFKSGKVILPNKMTLRYTVGDTDIYGAKLLENIVQALARIVIMQVALRLARMGYRFVLQAHDELVYAVHESRVERAKQDILWEMLQVPDWLPGLPLAAEIGVGDNYGNCK